MGQKNKQKTKTFAKYFENVFKYNILQDEEEVDYKRYNEERYIG